MQGGQPRCLTLGLQRPEPLSWLQQFLKAYEPSAALQPKPKLMHHHSNLAQPRQVMARQCTRLG